VRAAGAVARVLSADDSYIMCRDINSSYIILTI